MSELSKEEAIKIGALMRASAGSLYVQCFAAEMIGESYPLGKESVEIVFQMWPDDETLGRKVVQWQDEQPGEKPATATDAPNDRWAALASELNR